VAILLPLLASPASPAADPTTVDRSIRKEPAYRAGGPKYGLLLFGPEAKERVWLVLDGDALYVDRNGNGDLTEPRKNVAAKQVPGRDPKTDGYVFDCGELKVGGQIHARLVVSFRPLKRYADGDMGELPEVRAVLAKEPDALAVRLQVDVQMPGMAGGEEGGRVRFDVGSSGLLGVPVFAATPAEAPVIRLGGPLRITLYERPGLRVGHTGELYLAVGSPGIGFGTFACVGYQDTVPESANPVVEIAFPAARPGAPPIQERYEIRHRC
jgi:hypothetical protein